MRVALPIHTKRLIIRAFTLADQPEMQQLYADPLVMLHIDTRGQDPSTWVAAYIRHQQTTATASGRWRSGTTGELIGEAGLAPLDGLGPQLELGYLLRRDRWGRGLATEAAGACLAAALRAARRRRAAGGHRRGQRRVAAGRPQARLLGDGPAPPPRAAPARAARAPRQATS